jgi:DNA-binding XRE family transcriptional regulator
VFLPSTIYNEGEVRAMANLNDQLRQRRQALKLTQQAVAQQLHVSRQTISN